VAVGCLAVVLLLWRAFAVGRPRTPDLTVYQNLHSSRGALAAEAAAALTRVGTGWPLLACLSAGAFGAWLRWRRLTPLAVASFATAGAATASSVLKAVVNRPRPPMAGWLVQANGRSFPSGHATDATAAYLGLGLGAAAVARAVISRCLAIVGGVLLSGGIGLSRVVLGVHWPSDVVAGWALGGAAATLAWTWFSRPNPG
jgi:undecaprenyl-diphosphatase